MNEVLNQAKPVIILVTNKETFKNARLNCPWSEDDWVELIGEASGNEPASALEQSER